MRARPGALEVYCGHLSSTERPKIANCPAKAEIEQRKRRMYTTPSVLQNRLPEASLCGFGLTGSQLTQLTAPECPGNTSMNSFELMRHT